VAFLDPGTGLNDKQELFCREYTVGLDAKKSAIAAGYSEQFAGKTATRLMRREDIRHRIRELMKERTEATKVTAERVVAELARLAFSNMKDIMRWDREGVEWFDSDELDRHITAAIQEVKETTRSWVDDEGNDVETLIRSIKLHPKLTALQELAKHVGIAGETGVGVQIILPGMSPEQTEEKFRELFDDIERLPETTTPTPDDLLTD
jgi:phage terminase small subunit